MRYLPMHLWGKGIRANFAAFYKVLSLTYSIYQEFKTKITSVFDVKVERISR